MRTGTNFILKSGVLARMCYLLLATSLPAFSLPSAFTQKEENQSVLEYKGNSDNEMCKPKELVVNGDAVSNNEEFKYIGNSYSRKFHRPWCPFEQAMNPHKAVFFHFRKDAVEAGFNPCRYCLPPFVKQVRCVLLNCNLKSESK
jgi:hypothetical protein